MPIDKPMLWEFLQKLQKLKKKRAEYKKQLINKIRMYDLLTNKYIA